MKPTVHIHTNSKQFVGAIISAHSLKRNSPSPDAFDVEILRVEDYPIFREHEGRRFLRAGSWRTWKNDDLQSFTPLRLMPPGLMGYSNRSLVIDPDIFAVGDVFELLSRDMEGKSIMARERSGHNGKANYIASSVMLLDNSKLRHWDFEKQFTSMFEGKLDYEDWNTLSSEKPGSIGFIEPVWNDFDRLTAETKLLHNTKRRTQPWKTGLPIDFTNRVPLISKFLPENGIRLWGKYKKHPDPRQEALFYAFLKECVDAGKVSRKEIETEMRHNHLRHDSLAMMDRAPGVDSLLRDVSKLH